MSAFQQARGLPADGICDRVTWMALVEASWELGDRTLYLRAPNLRGDDVAELQRQLGRLGFDPGRVDGIFGPATTAALAEFQRNVELTRRGRHAGPRPCGRSAACPAGLTPGRPCTWCASTSASATASARSSAAGSSWVSSVAWPSWPARWPGRCAWPAPACSCWTILTAPVRPRPPTASAPTSTSG